MSRSGGGPCKRDTFWLLRLRDGRTLPIESVGGGIHKVSGGDLVRIPRQQYANVVVNLEMVERFLDLCMYVGAPIGS